MTKSDVIRINRKLAAGEVLKIQLFNSGTHDVSVNVVGKGPTLIEGQATFTWRPSDHPTFRLPVTLVRASQGKIDVRVTPKPAAEPEPKARKNEETKASRRAGRIAARKAARTAVPEVTHAETPEVCPAD